MQVQLNTPDVSVQSYFDELPLDALYHVIRHLSERPRCVGWHEYVNPHDAGMLYGVWSTLSDAATNSFTMLNGLSPTNLHSGELRVTTTEGHCHLPLILSRGAGTLVHLSLGYRSASLSGREWLNRLRSHAGALRSLDLCGAFDLNLIVSVLESIGARLHKLIININHRDVEYAISTQCTALAELKVLGRDVTLGGMWPALGAHLLSLSFASSVRSRIELDEIAADCVALESLELISSGRRRHLDQHIAALYKSYGARLHRVKVSQMPPELCMQVAAACPNARCSGIFDDKMARCVQALGARLECLKLDVRESARVEGVAESLRACVALRELHIFFRDSSSIADTLRHLLSRPLPTVEKLSIESTGGSLPCIEQECAMNTGGLRHLHISGLHKMPHLGHITRHNPNLRNVHIGVQVEPVPGDARTWVSILFTAMEQMDFCREQYEIVFDIRLRHPKRRQQFIECLLEKKGNYRSHRYCNHSVVVNQIEMFT